MSKNPEVEPRKPGLTTMQKLAFRSTDVSVRAQARALINPNDENRARLNPDYQVPIPTQSDKIQFGDDQSEVTEIPG